MLSFLVNGGDGILFVGEMVVGNLVQKVG